MKKRGPGKPRKPYLAIALSKREVRDLLELLAGVDREGGFKMGAGDSIHSYDNIEYRLRRALLRAQTES